MTTPFITYNQALRGFDFSPWGGIEGFLSASKAGQTGNTTALTRLVPDLAKAVDMTAVAVAAMPFDFLDENGDVFDTSGDWQNKLGGIPNPQRLIYLLAASLCGGSAYLIPTRTPRAIFDLQYCAPYTVTPYIDMNGLQYFSRTTDTGKNDNFIKPKEIIYFWLPDSSIEIGPAQNHPLGNALQDAEAVWNLKNTVRIFGERGFVPITLLGAKGMPNETERQKAEGFFDRLLRGGFETLAKIINAEALSIIKVGAGMDELKGVYLELRRDAKESIADSFSIPSPLFMSDNAYASEFDALRKQWYTTGRLVSIYQTIEEVMTEQLLKAYGKRMKFTPETMEVFQDNEADKAGSLNTLVTSIQTDPRAARLGMEILGYDLTDEQQAELDAIIAESQAEPEPEPTPAPAPEQSPAMMNEQEPMEEEEKPETDNPPEETKTLALSADDIKDLALWYAKSKVWMEQGKGGAVDWENKHLSETIAAPIRLKLAMAQTVEDVTRAFEFTGTTTPAPVYIEKLLEGMRLSLKALEAINEK